MNDDKICNKCGVILILDNNFTKSQIKKQDYICRDCKTKRTVKSNSRDLEKKREYERQYRIKNRKHINRNKRISRIKSTYGITLDEYDDIVSGACTICLSTDNLVLDHDHTTSKIRGVLCSTCNTSLGSFRDSIENLERAINYLKSRGENDK